MIDMIKKIVDAYIRFYIWVLVKLGYAQWTKRFNRRRIINRALVLIDEAKKRGLSIENLKKGFRHLRFYRVKLNGKYYFYESVPLGHSYNKIDIDNVSDKWFSKKILQRAGLLTPAGRVISSLSGALDYIAEKGFPVVIKPLNKSLCIGVTINIRNASQLERAIEKVKKYKKFLIETHLIGENYRVTVVDGRVVGVAHRLHPRVTGDGKQTIQELINIKNKDPRRGRAKNFTLHPIKIDDFTHELLTEQNFNLNSIPKKDQIVILNKRINLGSGADTIDLTDKIHPQIAKMAIDIARLFDAKVLGLDVLAPDITKAPSKLNQPAIIEVNSFPFIDMHHYPYEGKTQNVAGAIWDMVLKEIKN
jgi:cyanophycin synthetase